MNLSYLSGVQDGSIAALAAGGRLVEVVLRGCVKLSAAGLRSLRACRGLMHADFSGCLLVDTPAVQALVSARTQLILVGLPLRGRAKKVR